MTVRRTAGSSFRLATAAVAIGCLDAIGASGCYASSRSMLTTQAIPDRI